MPTKVIPDNALTKSAGEITKGELIDMIVKYRCERHKLVQDHKGLDDARWCWFSKDEIKAFLAANQCTDDKDWGIRIYYGVHPDTDPEYAKHHNIILVATLLKDNEDHDQLENNASVSIAGGVAYDNGALCPPRCNKKMLPGVNGGDSARQEADLKPC